MAIPRIYIDTSVLGGCFDEEYEDDSNRLLKEFISGQKIAVISDLLLLELEDAPEEVKDLFKKIPDSAREYVQLDEESIALANAYIQEQAAADSNVLDARHIAIATVARADVLVSWNYKHIVNLNRIRRFNAVNLKQGYMILEIRSPTEVLYEE